MAFTFNSVEAPVTDMIITVNSMNSIQQIHQA